MLNKAHAFLKLNDKIKEEVAEKILPKILNNKMINMKEQNLAPKGFKKPEYAGLSINTFPNLADHLGQSIKAMQSQAKSNSKILKVNSKRGER